MKKQFTPLRIDSYQTSIPTAFDESLTMLEKINNVIHYLATTNDNFIEVVENWNTSMDWLHNEGLSTEVIQQLDTLKNNGELENLINEALFEGKEDKSEALNKFNTLNDSIQQVDLEKEDKTDAEEKFNSSVFYNGVTYEQQYDESADGIYFITRVPRYDKDNSLITLKRGFADDLPNGGHIETARTFAKRTGATVVSNASIFNVTTNLITGRHMVDGLILTDVAPTSSSVLHTLAWNDQHEFKYFEPGIPCTTIQLEGYTNCLTGFIPLVNDSQPISDTILNTYTAKAEKHPRQCIGVLPDKSLLFLSTDGRAINGMSQGFTAADVRRILVDLGCQFAFMIDGGGSTQTTVRGSLINQAIDEGGLLERKVPDFLYVGKNIPSYRDRNIVELSSQLGEANKKVQELYVQLYKKIEVNGGYLQLKAPEGFTFQGIESWEGDTRNSKLNIWKDSLSFYDYATESNLFRVDNTGTLLTKKGTFGTFLNSAKVVTNLNNYLETGIYWSGPTAVGNPDTTYTYGVLNIRVDSTNGLQVAFPFHATLSAIKMRRTDATGGWAAWR